MKPLTALFTILLLLSSSCGRGGSAESRPVADDTLAVADTIGHVEKPGAYYWKTVLNLDSTSRSIMRRHDIGRLYVRMFDVVTDPAPAHPDDRIRPNATIRISDDQYQLILDSLQHIEIVPTVYVTLEALKAFKDGEDEMAEKIVTRVANMVSYNAFPNVSEMQIDCDWTSSTEEDFFEFCRALRRKLQAAEPKMELSSTIRLHQLGRPVPPVDRGVLMVYNTGSFDNPDAQNSIIDIDDVKPYMKYLPGYRLHLDVAYPAYSWQLLFRGRKFIGLANDLDLNDTAKFKKLKDNVYEAVGNFSYHGSSVLRGDRVRLESADPEETARVSRLIDSRLGSRPHSNIIYHLDSDKLSKYSADEISSILAPSDGSR